MASIMVVEDERLLGQTISASLTDDGHRVQWLPSAEAASEWLADHSVDLALVDLRLPGRDGLDLLGEILQSHPDTAVVMMTAHGDVQSAVAAIKLGAADFLTKPIDLEAVSMIAGKNLRQRRVAQNWRHEQARRKREFGLDQIIGRSAEIEKAKALIRRLAGLGVQAWAQPPNVLITGETGTGKDLLARALHYEGPRRDGPFVQVNCAALPESLAESELFGHVRGAFTDAKTDKRGLFEVADHGALFLDEVCSLPRAIQAKILTAIETGRIRPVGGAEERSVSVHVIAAMNRDPALMVERGEFREDLYHRLRVIHVNLPPLRQRGADLDLLADHFITLHCRNFGLAPRSLSPEARGALHAYAWPGNVRELSHRLESAVLLSDGTLPADWVPRPEPRRNSPTGEAATGSVNAGSGGGESLVVDFSAGPVALEGMEKAMILSALTAANNNVSRAADLLCITRDTLRYRLEKYGLQVKRMSGVQSQPGMPPPGMGRLGYPMATS